MKKGSVKKFLIRYKVAIILGIFILLLVSPLLFGRGDPNLLFNQYYIQGLDYQYDAATFNERIQYFFSFYTFRLNNMLNHPSNDVAYTDVDAMFSYLFKRLPYYAIVHPTEHYYYYLFPIEGKNISGNLRLVEIDNGRISMGYFDANDARGQSQHKMFTVGDGLIIEKKSDYLYKLTYEGKTVRFRISALAEEKPKHLQIHPEEEFIASVRDESGIIFYMFFNHNVSDFYYVLNEERPVTEVLINNGDNIYLGERTGFAYYFDEEFNRKILFGISVDNIYNNNYYDGPFDQVPPFLDLKDKIYKAYPYTQFGSGVDTYGNFLDRDGVRVSISPYKNYYIADELHKLVSDCTQFSDNSAVWGCLTYDEKRDFHKDSPMFYENGTLKSTANH